jgi:hypothetical protein
MLSRRTAHLCFPALLLLALRPGLLAAPQPRQQQQPTFRGGVTAVPIDVRVVDRAGRPVTDLKQEDFTVFEDGTGEPHSTVPDVGWDRPASFPGVALPGMDAAGMQALGDLRLLAGLTGGTASIMGYATTAADRIDAQTRVNYLLVYYPSNPSYDGRYRKVKVEVNRPGVTALFRHGYYGRKQDEVAISRRAVITDGRLAAAATSGREIHDIRLTSILPTFTKASSGAGGELLVSLVIDGGRLLWTADDLSRHVAHLEVAILCGDARQKIVGRTSRTLDITLTEGRFAQLATQGLPYSVKIPVKAPARFVKVIVYNYEADLLGSAMVKMK